MRLEVARQAVRDRRRALAWWSLGLVSLVLVTLAVYPSIRDSAGLADYAEDLPEAMRALFAGGEADVTSGPGYLDSQLYAFMAPLLLSIFAIGMGAAAVAGEEERGTLDLLLAQPVRRGRLVLERFAAMALILVALSGVLFVSVAGGSELFGLDIGLAELVAGTGGVTLLALVFGGVALAAGSIAPGRARAAAIGAGIAIAAWVLDGLGQIVNALEPWRPLSPYYQALGTDPLRNGIPAARWALLLAITAALALIAAIALQRRDVRG